MAQQLASTRLKILYWVLLPVLAGLGVSWAAAAVLLNQQAENEIYSAISSEADELRVVAQRGSDPVTGQTFGSSKALLEYFMSTRIPDTNQSMLALVDGEPFVKMTGANKANFEEDATFITRAASDAPTIGRIQTESGELIFGSLPLTSQIDSGNFVVVYFADDYKANYQVLLLELGAISLGSILVALGFGWLAAGRVLRPIRQLGSTAKRISDQNLTERISISEREASTELGGIAKTFNRMMDRIQEGFNSQRKFVDDAGHELRTPLTIIRGNLELHSKALKSASQPLEIAMDEVNRMSLLVADLQTLTSSTSPDFLHIEQFSLGDLLDELLVKAESLGNRSWLMGARSEAQVSGDKARLTQAALQLVENAVKHTSPGAKIQISAGLSPDGYAIAIDDSGPGIPESERTTIRDRFVRGSEVTPDVPGSGLGLAVVSAIAESHGGELFLEDSELGGLRARIWIPEPTNGEDAK